MPHRVRSLACCLRSWLPGALLALSAPAWAADTGGGLFSVTKPAFGLVDGRLFAGEGTGSLDGTGSLRVVSQVGPDGPSPPPTVTCQGRFEHNLRTGKGTLTCDNGETADFTFRFTGVTSGVGEGRSLAHGPIRFTFGLDAEDATRALELPAGTRIRLVDGGAGRGGPPAYRLEEPEKAGAAPLPASTSGAPITTPASGAESGASLSSPASTAPHQARRGQTSFPFRLYDP